MPRGRGRGRGRVLRLSARAPPTPIVREDISDADALDGADDNTPATPAQDVEDDDDNDNDNDDDENMEDPAEDAGSPPRIQSIPRKRGRGRPPSRLTRNDWNTPDREGDEGSESGTPQRRRRGRPSGAGGGWRGGFRGRPRGAPAQSTRVPVDKDGNMMDVVDDEVQLPEDPEGEKKVDKNGVLQDGRDYRVRVFTILGRGDRLYMLSTEPARCTGFRDSYLFFTKHLQLFKIIIDENEKKDLISRDLIPHSYKGRSIGVVTARSVFREFGSRIVIGGKKITDDYQVQEARERGDIEGELADPQDRIPGPGETYNKNQYVAWHGASQVYHNNQPSVPLQTGKPAGSKRKMNVTTTNWQFEHAKEASRFNTTLTSLRRANLAGVYDSHTNLLLYPKIMQPTHAYWTHVTPSSRQVSNGYEKEDERDKSLVSFGAANDTHLTGFKPVPEVVSRNFFVTDTYFESPATSNLGVPGPDGDAEDIGTNGLSSIPQHLLDELPSDCRIAFERAKDAELEWKTRWGTEQSDGSRSKLRIGFSGFPV